MTTQNALHCESHLSIHPHTHIHTTIKIPVDAWNVTTKVVEVSSVPSFHHVYALLHVSLSF